MPIRIGGNSAPQGFTERCERGVRVFGPRVMLWLSSADPTDADKLPADCLHVYRCANWRADESADDYTNRIRGDVTRWYMHVPGVVIQLGNEPDLEAGHFGERFADMAHQVRKQLFPNLRLANPPLRPENTGSLQQSAIDAADFVTAHCYWETFAPQDIANEGLGAAYRILLRKAGGKPVIVTEVNAVTAREGTAINWGQRNRQVAEWLHQANDDGVAAAAIFIFDALGATDRQWDGFDYGEEAAAETLRLLNAMTPVPHPDPLPVPHPAPTAAIYTRDVQPLHTGITFNYAAWRDYIASFGNTAEVDEILTAYATFGPQAIPGYDLNLLVAQGDTETGHFLSPRWKGARNAAGIGIYADDTPDVNFGTIERGIQAQIELVSDYFGTGNKPWGVLAEFGFGFRSPRGFVTLNQLDGNWAANTEYSAVIVERANAALTGVIPTPLPPPAPDAHLTRNPPLLWPVSPNLFDIEQGSDGAFSHGGAVASFYAIDFGIPRGSPTFASAAGTVTEEYTADWNPRSARTGPSLYIEYDNGYSSFSCHLSAFSVHRGDRVAQGQVIGLTGNPAIDGGYGSGDHLHWEIYRAGVRVRAEDLEVAGVLGFGGTVAPVEEGVMPINDGFSKGEVARMFNGGNTAAQQKKWPYHPDYGFEQAYLAFANAGVLLGSAISDEEEDHGTPGRSIRYFTCGKITRHAGVDAPNEFYADTRMVRIPAPNGGKPDEYRCN